MKKTPYKYQCASLILAEGEHGDHALILGDAQAPLSKQILSKYKIGMVISIGQEAAPNKKQSSIKYHLIKLRDQKDQPIADYFDNVTDLIQQSRKKCAVLIHCYHGASRSASFVIAYVIKKLGLQYQEARQFVKKRRQCVSPNEGFVKQLCIFSETKPTFKSQNSIASDVKIEEE